MKVVKMKAERRTALGRNQVAQLRKQGWLPAVVYGDGKEPQSVSISEWEIEQHVKAHHKVFDLDIGGTKQAAFLQEVTWHVTNDRPVHVDFKRIDLTKEIDAEVEVSLIGYPVGLGKGGALTKDHIVIMVRCLPTAIPDEIEHDITSLDLDQSLTAGQLALPAGVVLVTPPTTSVCRVAKAVAADLGAPAAVVAPAEGAAPAAGATPPAAKS